METLVMSSSSSRRELCKLPFTEAPWLLFARLLGFALVSLQVAQLSQNSLCILG